MKKMTKLFVFTRDGFKCQRCGVQLYFYTYVPKTKNKKRAHIHHIKHRSQGGDNSPENLLSTCWPCECKDHKHKGRYYHEKDKAKIIKRVKHINSKK